MGQKVNPIGLRLGINRTWDSRWYAGEADYAKWIAEDFKIRKFVEKNLENAGVAKVVIERPAQKCRVFIHTARPGVIIGKKGADIETLRKKLQKFTDSQVFVNIVEIRKPDLDAQLIADNIASQIKRRVSYRRAMKRAVQNAMMNGALGVKISCSGLVGGASSIARTEWYMEGSIPLHTLRADIDYGFAEAVTGYGIIAMKVWINNGERYDIDRSAEEEVKN